MSVLIDSPYHRGLMGRLMLVDSISTKSSKRDKLKGHETIRLSSLLTNIRDRFLRPRSVARSSTAIHTIVSSLYTTAPP
jgi:hypothetical protein